MIYVLVVKYTDSSEVTKGQYNLVYFTGTPSEVTEKFKKFCEKDGAVYYEGNCTNTKYRKIRYWPLDNNDSTIYTYTLEKLFEVKEL